MSEAMHVADDKHSWPFFMPIQNRKKGIGDETKKQNRVNDLAKENRYLE
jgi:hypothetical protein